MKKKISDLLRGRIPALILLAVFWAAVSMLHPLSASNLGASLSTGRTGELVALSSGDHLSVSFTCNQQYFYGIRVWIRKSTSDEGTSAQVTLKDGQGDVIQESSFTLDDLDSNGCYGLSFTEIPDSREKQYTFELTGISTNPAGDEEGAGIQIYLSSASPVLNDRTSKNGNELEDVINYQILFKSPSWPVILRCLYISLILVSVLMVLFLGNNLPANFLALAVLSGFTIVVNPVPHTLDEPTHLTKAFDIAAGHLTYETKDGESGVSIPSNYHDFLASYRNKIDLKTIYMNHEELSQTFSSENVFEATELMNSYPFPAYIASALGIALARALRMPVYMVLIMGRLFNYLVYMALGYIAVRKTNTYKGVIASILLLPMLLSIAGSVHSDTFLDVSAVLLVSLILHYTLDEEPGPVKRSDIVLFMICVCGISSSKYLIYTPLLLLFFAIPKDRFASKKQWGSVLAIALVFVAVLAAFQFWLLTVYPYTEPRVDGVDVNGQIQYILSHKRVSFERIFLFLIDNLHTYFLPTQLATERRIFSSVEFLMPCTVYVAAFTAPDKRQIQNAKVRRALYLLIPLFALLVAMLIIVSLYCGFTEVGARKIIGVQARYFYPILLPVVLLIGSLFPAVTRKTNHYSRNLSTCMLFGILDLLVAAMVSM